VVIDGTDASSPGDLGRAYLLLRAVSGDAAPAGEGLDTYAHELTNAPGDRDEVLRGLGTIIGMFMELLRKGLANGARHARETERDPEGRPHDLLHVVVPAVVAKLAATPGVSAQAVPTMAGALTAAAFGGSCHDWRMIYGPWRDEEPLPWALTAWYLADLIDSVSGERGHALNVVQTVMTDAILLVDGD
jgi:hypothetical protein